MNDKQTAPADYEVVQSREIGGRWRDAGERLQMLPLQAKYYLPPHGTGLKATGPADKAKRGARPRDVPSGDAETPETRA